MTSLALPSGTQMNTLLPTTVSTSISTTRRHWRIDIQQTCLINERTHKLSHTYVHNILVHTHSWYTDSDYICLVYRKIMNSKILFYFVFIIIMNKYLLNMYYPKSLSNFVHVIPFVCRSTNYSPPAAGIIVPLIMAEDTEAKSPNLCNSEFFFNQRKLWFTFHCA